MAKENTDRLCNGPDCKKPARPGSEFCSDTCRELTEKEMNDAPYGDQYLFPALTEE